MKRLADILKEAMTPGFEKAFTSSPKGVEVHMKHKESGEIHKQKFIGTHSAVAAAKKHIDAMQKKGYTLHAKKLIEQVEIDENVEESTGVTDYNPKSQGGTRKELLAKYHKTKNPKDAEAARKAGATQKELQGEEVEINEMDKSHPSSSRGAEGHPVGKEAKAVSYDKVKKDALKALQQKYKKVKEEVEDVEEAKAMKNMSDQELKNQHDEVIKKINAKGGVSSNDRLAQKARTIRTGLAMRKATGMTKEEDDQVEEAMSHQAKTTMKHVKNPTKGEKEAAKDIKPGTSGYSDRYAMLQSAKARGALKENLLEILREMAKRGRPKKNPAPIAAPKKKMDDDEDEDDQPDTGPEADKNITVQLKKAADQAVHGEKGGADVEFADGKKHFVHGHVAHTVLKAMERMKPAQRAEAQKGIQQSHTHLMTVHKMLTGK